MLVLLPAKTTDAPRSQHGLLEQISLLCPGCFQLSCGNHKQKDGHTSGGAIISSNPKPHLSMLSHRTSV